MLPSANIAMPVEDQAIVDEIVTGFTTYDVTPKQQLCLGYDGGTLCGCALGVYALLFAGAVTPGGFSTSDAFEILLPDETDETGLDFLLGLYQSFDYYPMRVRRPTGYTFSANEQRGLAVGYAVAARVLSS
jgi:hypothetical protein